MSSNLYYYRAPEGREEKKLTVDVCVYGGNAAGIVAAVQLRREGKSVVVIEPGGHVGGLTAGGLSCTDFGNKAAIGGISRDLYREMGAHYGVAEEWNFEPSVAETTLLKWVKQNDIPVYFRNFLESVVLDGVTIKSIRPIPVSQ